MLLYYIHDMQMATLMPWRAAAEMTEATMRSPYTPGAQTHMGRAVAAGAELFERSTRRFAKPKFNINSIKVGNDLVDIEEQIIDSKPFCNLLHFRRATSSQNLPRVLIVAPMSGHHSTLLRGTVETMMQDHDVYITDWVDARMVPLYDGLFDLDDYIAYVIDYLRLLGPDVHVVAVCQPAVPVLCAVALMADMDDPAQPRSMTLMGGPIDTRSCKTAVTEFAETRPMEWFRNTVIHALPFYYPGANRLVYPGFIQLNGFMAMNVERHVSEHFKLFENLVKGDDDSVTSHTRFYDEYLSVMDVTAEFYLQTVDKVFKQHALPNGTYDWRGRIVKPEAIRKTALLTVEGELDDISGAGQTRPALELCSNLPDDMKQMYLQIGVGHYGIFSGRRWRENVYPILRDFIAGHQA